MKKESLNNHIHFPYHSPWRLGKVPPANIYFTDQGRPPDGHIETDQAISADDHVDENLDCSYLLRGLWSESTKKWFVWNDDEGPRVIKVAVDIEKLCEDFDIKKWWWWKVRDFVEFKAAYDEKKVDGKYVDPREDWPFDPCHPREVSLPGDIPAIYALLCRFHDWVVGFDQLFSEGDPAVVEFSSRSSRSIDIDFEQQFEQRSVRIEELETFLECVKKDIEDKHVCRQAENLIENENRKIPDEDILPDEHEEPVEEKKNVEKVKHVKKLSKAQKKAWESYQWILDQKIPGLIPKGSSRWYSQKMYEYLIENSDFYPDPKKRPSYDSWSRHLRQYANVYEQMKTAVQSEDVQKEDLSKPDNPA